MEKLKALVILGEEAGTLWDEQAAEDAEFFVDIATLKQVEGWEVREFRNEQHMLDFMEGAEAMSGWAGEPIIRKMDAQ